MKRYQIIAAHRGSVSVTRLCADLAVSRSGYYAWLRRGPSARAQRRRVLREQVEQVFEHSRRSYGSPRVTAALRARGLSCNHKPVEALMREAQLVARPTRRRQRVSSPSAQTSASANLLDRDFNASAPNTCWLVDMTQLPTHAGWLYLAAVLDVFSRKIVGFATADSASETLALNALHLALSTRQTTPGLLHHSDRGSPYRSNRYLRLLALHQLTSSMSRPHSCWDNAPIESFFSTLKAELDVATFHSYSEARVAIFDYIETFYNRVRLHSALGYRSPDDFERAARS